MHAYSFLLAETKLAHENRTTKENILFHLFMKSHTHTQYTEARTLK